MLTTKAASEIIISMQPLVNIPAAEGFLFDFAGFYFEPNLAIAEERTCASTCPCAMPDQPEGTPCNCDMEVVCGGEIAVDLSADDKLTFHWDASNNDSQYITIRGTGRTRIEFEGKYDCGDASAFQELTGADISFVADFVDVDGYQDTDGESQSFVYNAAVSFVELGKCAQGCGIVV